MSNSTLPHLALATLDTNELSTVTGGQNKPKKEKSLGEKVNDLGKKVMEEAYKWGGEIGKIAEGARAGGVGPGLISPGITAKAVYDLERPSEA
ncbi:MAG: hypothetical protein AB7O24_31205 [Kofleriaceae bacterium]